jgi:hypothetical protein
MRETYRLTDLTQPQDRFPMFLTNALKLLRGRLKSLLSAALSKPGTQLALGPWQL